ncbi:DUF6582 domain-containing protein [Xanthobacter versatilis]|uniref:DUF6582 domain-containing protein n=1 Tax=Xanthobacter autotrophicus (strain ATCC BAA-1158 / Py2) TaxID=78245 RepID=UPI003727F6ED
MQIAARLDKEARDALPAEHFAVPGKRKLPINDERHVRMAWDMVDRTQGVTPDEKAAARHRILHRANELGLDTTDWHKVAAMHLEAMSLNISNDDNHPNKMPFSGVLVRLDQISDAPPGGAGGRHIILTAKAAEQALSSLLGMAVDFTPSFDGHDAQAKIGLITSAHIVGNAIQIDGFVYASDFPAVAAHIRAEKDALGFSFEAQRIFVADPSADPLVITECVFTGAAILQKDKAAYRTTSLAASAAEDDFDMTKEELQALLAEAVKPISDRLEKVEAAAHASPRIDAGIREVVEPHASALESCAAALEAAGIGTNPSQGHAAMLRRLAGSMRADAAMGRLPTVHRDHDWPMNAGAVKLDASAIEEAVKVATQPLIDKIAANETKLADLKAEAFKAAEAPARKTLHPAITQLLAKAGITEPEDGKLSLAKLESAMREANITDPVQRISMKRAAGF